MNGPDPAEVPDRVPVSGTRKGPGARLVVLYGAMVLFLLAVFGLNKPRGLLEETLRDLREIFYFGFAGLVILELTALIGRRWIRKRSLYYAVAFIAVGGLVSAYELFVMEGGAQSAGRGLQSLLGAYGFLALSAALDRDLKREHAWLRGWPRRSLGILGALLVAGVLHPLGPVLSSYAGRAGAFPIVVDLASDWQEPFIETQGAELFVGKGPDQWPRVADRRVALLLMSGAVGDGVLVHEPFKDWSDFELLKLHLYSTAAEPVRVNIRLSDRSRLQAPGDRVDYGLRVVPGVNDFYIPLEALSYMPSGERLDMDTIRRFGLYLAEPADPLRLYVHRVRLLDE